MHPSAENSGRCAGAGKTPCGPGCYLGDLFGGVDRSGGSLAPIEAAGIAAAGKMV